jgi:hypothetical protein
LAFGIDTYDQTSGSTNRCGVYSIRLQVDSALMFSQTMNRFSFAETRYINSLIDYDYYIDHRARFNRMYIEPNNRLSVYGRHVDRGVASFSDSGTHRARITVRDFHNNSAQLDFAFDYAPDSTVAGASTRQPMTDILAIVPDPREHTYKRERTHVLPGLRVIIPADALYAETDFTCTATSRLKGLYSDTYKIHRPGTPLHKAITVEIAADSLPERLREKALLVMVDAPSGRRSSAGGAYRDGVVSATPRVFGQFAIGVDTVPPRITPINIRNGANMTGASDIRLKISDDFSGIRSYNGWIDQEWALFEYDAKNNLLYYRFDAERLSKSTTHTLRLTVVDEKGNAKSYHAKFTW